MRYQQFAKRLLISTLTLCLAIVLPGSLFLQTALAANANVGIKPICVYVSSYEKNDAWSSGIESGLRAELKSACFLKTHYMNTRQIESTSQLVRAAVKAKKYIKAVQPNILITSDDVAAKYLLRSFYKNHKLPVVFSGINWTVEEYGLPYTNTAGIVEVAAIEPLLNHGFTLSNSGSNALYIGSDTLSEQKDAARFFNSAQQLGINLTISLASSYDEWKKLFVTAKDYDFVILGNANDVSDWSMEDSAKYCAEHSAVPSLTNHKEMMHCAGLGYTKIAEEQGTWAGKIAVSILKGAAPSEIPIVTNRKWDLWVNNEILRVSETSIDQDLRKKAKKSRNDFEN